jgi:hypothetical protein
MKLPATRRNSKPRSGAGPETGPASGMVRLHGRPDQNAKQLQPNAPQKPAKLETGTLDLRATSWE